MAWRLLAWNGPWWAFVALVRRRRASPHDALNFGVFVVAWLSRRQFLAVEQMRLHLNFDKGGIQMQIDEWTLIILLCVAFLFGVGIGIETNESSKKKKQKSDD